MTLKEVAQYLRLAETTIARMARDGEVPAQKFGNGWQFSRTAVDAWKATRSVSEQRLPVEATGLSEPLTVAGAMSADHTNLALQGADKDAVLRELVGMVIDPGNERHAELFFQALKAREDLCSTCVNDGIAIPHARNALVGLVNKPLLAYGRHVAGVDFGAMDGQPVRHFFLLCSPNVREHLQLLARLSRVLHKADFRKRLETVDLPADVIALVRDAEQANSVA
ncbi:MAG: PTS sugar transporter subunit IIA [Verrucomicrobiota bacterium]